VLTDLDGDGRAEIILLPATGASGVFRLDDRSWSYVGRLAQWNCAGMQQALRAGKFKIADAPFKELEVSGRRLRVVVHEDCATLIPASTP
jgi:hypothetical protein